MMWGVCSKVKKRCVV